MAAEDRSINKIDNLIAKGDKLRNKLNTTKDGFSYGFPDTDKDGEFAEWQTQGLNFLVNLLGHEHEYVISFRDKVTDAYISHIGKGQGILRAVKNDLEEQTISRQQVRKRVFIGHGRSKVWKDLKDYIFEKLELPYDEFNREPVAGKPNTVRLNSMLDNAMFAFLVMTAEDEQAGGKMHARMNVIHEAGLFQGRLGFEKAIILLEEGCEQFSNIEGLGHIRFPKGDITAKFHEIREVLEREINI